MASMAGMSRSFLSSKNLHTYSSVCRTATTTAKILGRRPGSLGPACRYENGSRLNQSRRYATVEQDSATSPSPVAIEHKPGTPAPASIQEFKSLKFTGDDIPTIHFPDGDTIHLVYKNRKRPHVVDRHWLRDACECSECVDPDSGQKNFSTCDVPTKLTIQKATITEDGELEVVWEGDFLSSYNHVSRYSRSLFKLCEHMDLYLKSPEPLPTKVLWDADRFKKEHLTVDYNNWMSGGSGFVSALHRLHTHGLVFIKNVPTSEDSVVSIANKIGNLQETFYGRTWDVRSKPHAENVAYTSSFLGLHQDLLYMQETPRIQLLHCLENTCDGGESMFSDGLRAASLMLHGPRHLYTVLKDRHVLYHYKRNGHIYQNSRPVLAYHRNAVFWSPPFQSSIQGIDKNESSSRYYRKWVAAATQFRRFIEDEPWMYQYKIQRRECVLFDNWRVLHGRRKFDTTTGSRWLKGAYIADDVFKSKLATLSPQLMKLGGTNIPLWEQAGKFKSKYKPWGHMSRKATKAGAKTLRFNKNVKLETHEGDGAPENGAPENEALENKAPENEAPESESPESEAPGNEAPKGNEETRI